MFTIWFKSHVKSTYKNILHIKHFQSYKLSEKNYFI